MDVKGTYTANKFDEIESEQVVSFGSLSPMSYNATYLHNQDGSLDWRETTFSMAGGQVSRKPNYKYTQRSLVDFVDQGNNSPDPVSFLTMVYFLKLSTVVKYDSSRYSTNPLPLNGG